MDSAVVNDETPDPGSISLGSVPEALTDSVRARSLPRLVEDFTLLLKTLGEDPDQQTENAANLMVHYKPERLIVEYTVEPDEEVYIPSHTRLEGDDITVEFARGAFNTTSRVLL